MHGGQWGARMKRIPSSIGNDDKSVCIEYGGWLCDRAISNYVIVVQKSMLQGK